MNWGDLKDVVGKAAPTLGTMLGGPAGAAIGTIISTALGTKNTPEAVSDALAANPELAVKLQELQLSAKVQLEQLMVTAESNRLNAANEQYRAEADDRNSARILAAQQPHEKIREHVTYGLLFGAFIIVIIVMSGLASSMLKDATTNLLIGTLIGYWFNELKQALSFWYGATRESQQQGKKITDFAVQPGTVTTDTRQ